ncbi:MAG: hypothetical protein HRT61_17335, partial [Ekhidna sp.]|nr:hypothetical protein [Ekhidna sp.]
FTIGAGVKLPTGNPDSFSEQGIALPADLQAGSGALDGILFFSYQQSPRSRPSLSYISTAIFRYTGTNEEYFAGNSYRFGNELQVSLAAADRLFVGGLVIDPSIGIQYRKRGRDFFDGGEFPGSGGDFLFLNPGISTPINQKFSWQVNVSLPLYSKVVDTQLAPTLQLNMGISFKTNLKSDNKFLGI